MRTREEQISALAFKIGGVQASNATKQSAEAHILEAECRAEQRVRAEIARLRDLLERLRDVVSRGMTQSVPIPGQQYPIGSHHHPIWAEIHNALEGTET